CLPGPSGDQTRPSPASQYPPEQIVKIQRYGHPIRFNAVLSPNRYNCSGCCQLLHDLVSVEISNSQTFILPNAPSLSFKKSRYLQRQWVVRFRVADEDICHGTARTALGLVLRLSLNY